MASGSFSVARHPGRNPELPLDRAHSLTRHRNPSGNLEALLDLALDALLEKVERDRFGKVERPRAPSADKTPKSPTPPRHVRREVVARDGERCTFVAPNGTRCDCRAFLEFDHVQPAGLGGGTETGNQRLLCRTHNALLAERVYGREFIATAIVKRRRESSPATSRVNRASVEGYDIVIR